MTHAIKGNQFPETGQLSVFRAPGVNRGCIFIEAL
jgi:hypothetical protein